MRRESSSRGQNVIEYLLLTSTVIVVLIAGVLLRGGVFVASTNRVLDLPADQLMELKNSVSFVDENGVAVHGVVVMHPD